jgi:aspartate racemase
MSTVLTEAKRKELLEAYLQTRPESAPAKPSAAPTRRESSVAPLTFAQRQLWLHAQLAPETSLYNEPLTIRRHGPLDVSALERSFSEIVRRHEAWRTTFPVIDGEPVQKVGAPFEIKLPVIDLRQLSLRERESEATRVASKDAHLPFDLARSPLLRAKLVRLADEEYRLFVTLHHLIFDGFSGYRVFLPELVAIYAAFSKSKPSPLPALPYQFADYAIWQKESGGADALAARMEYWKRQLAGDLPSLQLPISRSRSGMPSFRGAMRSLSLPAGLSESLRQLSQQEGATLYMTLLAAFNVLLQRYSGQDEILVGSNTAGRNHPGSEKLLGYFLNTIVLRNDLEGSPAFREVLGRVRQTTLDALSNQEAPLDQLVAKLQPQRDLKRNPLFQVLFSLEPPSTVAEPGWDVTCIDVETGTTKFELCLVADDRPDGLLCRFIYNTDLFDADAIERMAGHWQTLLESIVAEPGQKISKLALLTQEERHRLLIECNNTAQLYEPRLVHELLGAQAMKTPGAVAVTCGGVQLTYAELTYRVDQLADYLRGLGVGPDVPVALCVERSVEMIVGIFGILKAGGAYVPIDPAYPRERIKFMVADCGADVLLTSSELARTLFASRPFAGVQTVLLDSSEWQGSQARPGELGAKANFDNLAYIIYTSGSTGGPKGVQITHRNLAHSNGARLDYYRDPVGSFLLLSSFGFDSSIAGIFHTLTTGGTLVVPPADGFHWAAEELAGLIAENRISHVLTFPSLYGDLLEHAPASKLASLRCVMVAGEACSRSLVDSHYRILPHASLFNEYGPTEATVWSSVYECEPGSVEAVPIGRPIANTQFFVLDPNLQPVPIGVPGELYIGGEGVARGYRNRPELTQASFIPNPLLQESGQRQRLYRAGDSVRYLADGNLEFLGRVDQQIKIRGLRIELAEIETALTSYPDVREAVVVAERNGSGDPKLVAYVTAHAEHATSSQELRALLKNRLPAYMVPTAVHFLKSLPRTPNGKVDRQALTANGNGSEISAYEALAPRNDVEKRLLAIWQKVLGTTSADIRQDFFELGGHSLLAARLLARIEKEFGRSLSLAFVFQSPTVEQMAESLLTAGQTLRERAIVTIQPHGSQAPLFWVRGGPRFRLLAQRLAGDRPFLGLDLPFTDGSRLPVPYRFEDIAALLIRVMREVQPKGPYYIAGLCVNAVIAYEIAQQLVRDGEEVALLAMLDAHNQAYYKNPFKDGRYTSRVKYHLSNLLKLDASETSAYLLDRLDEARRKIERVAWRLTSDHSGEERLRNTDSIIHPAFSRYEPQPYSGKIVLFQSSEWPKGPYFDFELGWKDLVGGGIEFHTIPGDHPSMFLEPTVNLVAEKLSSHLSEPVSGCI